MQSALDSLEKAVDSMAKSSTAGADSDHHDVRQALDSAMQQNENLQAVAAAVSVRLDQAVDRLKQALDE